MRSTFGQGEEADVPVVLALLDGAVRWLVDGAVSVSGVPSPSRPILGGSSRSPSGPVTAVSTLPVGPVAGRCARGGCCTGLRPGCRRAGTVRQRAGHRPGA